MPSSNTAACPYLGLRGDPGTACTFPAAGNCCYHCRTPQTPLLAHQQGSCLSPTHIDCPVFTAPPDAAFPRELRLKPDGDLPVRRRVKVLLPSILILTLILTTAWALDRFVWLPPPVEGQPAYSRPIQSPPVENPPAIAGAQTSPMPAAATAGLTAWATAASPADAVSPIVETTSRPTESPSVYNISPGPTRTAAPSATPQPHLLEAPIMAGEQALIIHWVKEGEGLELLAEIYNTSPQAIQAVNVSLTSPLWADSAIVIPAGVTAVDPALPPFDVYQVRVGLNNIDQAARYLNLDEEAMRYYNNCPDGCALQAGEWLLIPRLK